MDAVHVGPVQHHVADRPDPVAGCRERALSLQPATGTAAAIWFRFLRLKAVKVSWRLCSWPG